MPQTKRISFHSTRSQSSRKTIFINKINIDEIEKQCKISTKFWSNLFEKFDTMKMVVDSVDLMQ